VIGSDPIASVVVQVRGAAKQYASGLRALDPIDLVVRRGEFVTLVGPSGCGKSTLLRMVAGLTTPSGGSVALWPDDAAASSPPAGLPDARRAALGRLAFVFQSATLMPWATVEANVRLPLELARRPEPDATRRVAAALELVGLQAFSAAVPRELSGGMQMRVSIARALATEPGVLLMDEPFGALDEITRNRLDREVREIWARRSLTVLFVTHSVYEAVFLSTRVLVMSPRPGHIAGELIVDEPHPRSEAFRTSERFVHGCARLSALLAATAGDASADRAA